MMMTLVGQVTVPAPSGKKIFTNKEGNVLIDMTENKTGADG